MLGQAMSGSAGQYSRIRNGDEEDVEHGNPSATSTAALGDSNNPVVRATSAAYIDEEKPKILRSKPGIPVPARPPFRLALCLRWTFSMAVVFCGIYYVLRRLSTQERHLLEGIDTITVSMQNCDFLSLPISAAMEKKYGKGPILTVQHWNFMGSSTTFKDGSGFHISATMRIRLNMFRCLVTAAVAPDALPQTLSASSHGQDMSRFILEVAPAKRLDFHMQQTYFEASSLPEKLHMIAKQGNIVIRPPTLTGNHEVSVSTSFATLVVDSPETTSVALKGMAAQTSVLSGAVITDVAGAVVLANAGSTSAEPQLKITFDAKEDTPGFFVVGSNTGGLQVRRGEMQSGDHVTLTKDSETDMLELQKWIKDIGSTTAPWVARVMLRGPGHEAGIWHAVSSEAFLALPVRTFVLLSAGSLHPSIYDASVQLLGMQKAWPPSEQKKDKQDLDDQEMWQVFGVLQQYLSATEKSTIAWVPDQGRPIVFRKVGRKWQTYYVDLTKRQSLFFLVALVLNTLASAVFATFILYQVRKFQAGWNQLHHTDVSIAASHRLIHTNAIKGEGSAGGWQVMATQVDWPDHGVLLRWRKRTGTQRATFYYIYAESEANPTRGFKDHEVLIQNVGADRVPTMKDHSVICEFLFSIAGVAFNKGYETKHEPLHYQHVYRFVIEGFDKSEDFQGRSSWSNEVCITPRSSVFDFPFLLWKTYFPLPTPSLGFFLETYAQRHINGKIAQQIVVLEDLQITYHKNFSDFPYCNADFYLAIATPAEGETAEDCEEQTKQGRCVTYARCKDFTPIENATNPQLDVDIESDDLDEEEKRTQKLSGDLRLGVIDRDVREACLTMRFSASHEDVAEAAILWPDLMEQFEDTDQADEKYNQAYFCDLKTGADYSMYNEDYLVWFLAKVTFINSIDPTCVELPKDKRFFTKDSPGQIFYQGMERFITWDQESELMLAYAEFSLYASYPNCWWVEPKKVAVNVSKHSVGVYFLVDFPSDVNSNNVTCQIEVYDTHDQKIEDVVSHRFVICKTWTLSDMELMYAAFCKLNNIEMEHLTKDTLQKYELTTACISLKVIPRLRAPLQFEEKEVNMEDMVLNSDSMFLIGNRPITTHSSEERAILKAESRMDLEDRGSSDGGSKREKLLPFAPADTISGTLSADRSSSQSQVFRPTSHKTMVLEHVWAKRFGAISFGHGASWNPSFLLMYAFYPVDNIINGLTWLAEISQLSVLHAGAQKAFGSYRVDQFMNFANAPLYWILPFFAEAMLFLLQLVMFMSPPVLLLFISLAYEYLGSSLHATFDFLSKSAKVHSHIPDLIFQRDVSERGIEAWWATVSLESGIAIVSTVITVMVTIMLIFESNFCRSTLPWELQAPAHATFNYIGTMVVSAYCWILVVYSSMIVLWFIMAVVIYPEQMLTALACVAGVGIVLYGMYNKFRTTEEQIKVFLREEIPEILDLVCDNFLVDFERDRAARVVKLERWRVKCNAKFWKFMQSYLRRRFSVQHNDRLAERFKSFFDDSCEPTVCVHKIFDHALIKEKHWDMRMLEVSTAPSGVYDGSATEDVHRMSAVPRVSSEVGYDPMEVEGKRTDRVLAQMGLEQHDTFGESFFSLRQRLLDRETESGGEMVHTYHKELREKLMKVFVRMLDEQKFHDDITKVLEDHVTLAAGMFRSHKAKLKLFDPALAGSEPQRGESGRSVSSRGSRDGRESSTLMQLLIQHVHKQKMRKLNDYLAEHLDAKLDPGNISEHVTPFVAKRVPDDIRKRLRLTLDEHTVGSAMQKVIESLRRWMGNTPEDQMAKHLTLERPESKAGLRRTLIDIGILHEDCHRHYWAAFERCVQRKVRGFTRDDVTELVIDSADVEDFVYELLKPMTRSGQQVSLLWWGAMKQFLHQVGFPMTAAGDAHNLSEKQVMREFEAFAMRDADNALLPAEKAFDFLHKLTRGSTSDGTAGRLWKAQVIDLMQEVGICGHINLNSLTSNKAGEGSGDNASDGNMADTSGWQSYAQYKWPRWLEDAWNEVVPAWVQDVNVTSKKISESGTAKPFMPKTALHMFFRNVAFSKYETSKPTWLNLVEVNEDYDNWLKGEFGGHTTMWTKRGRKSFLKVRGIWHECFLGVLEKMDNGIADQFFGLRRFEEAMNQVGSHRRSMVSDCEGMLDIDEFSAWLKQEVVEVTSEVSATVFKQVLKHANVSIPPVVAESLWESAEPGGEPGGDQKKLHPWLRKVSDLEDRVVMYLAKGLIAESVRSLIFDELQAPSLQQLHESEVQAAFSQVDEKTGQCGFLEPHELQQMIRLLAQEGMTLDMLLNTFTRLKLRIPEKEVKKAFLMMDTNADDVIDVPEFLGMADYFILELIPNEIFGALGLQVQQIAMALLGAFCISIVILLFVLISLGAFQVELNAGGSNGAAWVRAGIAIGAVAGLKGDNSEASQEKLFQRARKHLYEMMGVSPSQMEARRRSNALGGQMQPMVRMPQAKAKIVKVRQRGSAQNSRDHDDRDDDDDHDDDDD